MNLKKGIKVRVSMDAPFHQARTGEFQFMSNDGTAVILDPAKSNSKSKCFFAVDPKHILIA